MQFPVRMSGRVPAAILPFLALFTAQPVMADELLLKDGSRLLGKVLKKEGATLEFETSYAGVIKVSWDAVSELRAEEPVKVMLEDETTLATGTIMKTEEATALKLPWRQEILAPRNTSPPTKEGKKRLKK